MDQPKREADEAERLRLAAEISRRLEAEATERYADVRAIVDDLRARTDRKQAEPEAQQRG